MTDAELIEKLAEIEHTRWAEWQRWCHDQGIGLSDGGILLPGNVVERWERQIATPYADLSEREKESDREQVRRYWDLIVAHFSPDRHPGPGSQLPPGSPYREQRPDLDAKTGKVNV